MLPSQIMSELEELTRLNKKGIDALYEAEERLAQVHGRKCCRRRCVSNV